jgi:hypothetical protein
MLRSTTAWSFVPEMVGPRRYGARVDDDDEPAARWAAHDVTQMLSLLFPARDLDLRFESEDGWFLRRRKMLAFIIGQQYFGDYALGVQFFLTRRLPPWPALNELIASENARDLEHQVQLGGEGIFSRLHTYFLDEAPMPQIAHSLRETIDVYAQMSDRLHAVSRKGYLYRYRLPAAWESQKVDDFRPIFGTAAPAT